MYARLGIEVSLVGDSLKALFKKLYPLDSKLIGFKATYVRLEIEVSLVGDLLEALFKKRYPLDSKVIWG